MADDEAATIAVTAVAAGDDDVDNILAELDEFDKARSPYFALVLFSCERSATLLREV
jgi:hypothetical protein